jgi:hypothetical protein
VPKSIAGVTVMKMMHKEVGFAEDMFVTKKCVIKEKLRCHTLDIQIQSLEHKQGLYTIRKEN